METSCFIEDKANKRNKAFVLLYQIIQDSIVFLIIFLQISIFNSKFHRSMKSIEII